MNNPILLFQMLVLVMIIAIPLLLLRMKFFHFLELEESFNLEEQDVVEKVIYLYFILV